MIKTNIDSGYYFGLGVFETIAVEQHTPLFLCEHLRRLKTGLQNLHINNPDAEKSLTEAYITQKCRELPPGRQVLKICVSEQNLIITSRENSYCRDQYLQGFTTALTDIRRNETSPLTYIKSLSCADNILAKRAAARAGISEPLFLNTCGELTEGAVSNIFLIKDGKLITPPLSCGLLPGVLRKHIMEIHPVTEQTIRPRDIRSCDEMFLTNSLMGIMPVKSFGQTQFSSIEQTLTLSREYFARHQINVNI